MLQIHCRVYNSSGTNLSQSAPRRGAVAAKDPILIFFGLFVAGVSKAGSGSVHKW